MAKYLKIESYRKINQQTNDEGKPILTKNVGFYKVRLTPEFEFVLNPLNFKKAFHEKGGKNYLIISDVKEKIYENRYRAARLLKPVVNERVGVTVLIGGNFIEFIPESDFEKSFTTFDSEIKKAEPVKDEKPKAKKNSSKKKKEVTPEPEPEQADEIPPESDNSLP